MARYAYNHQVGFACSKCTKTDLLISYGPHTQDNGCPVCPVCKAEAKTVAVLTTECSQDCPGWLPGMPTLARGHPKYPSTAPDYKISKELPDYPQVDPTPAAKPGNDNLLVLDINRYPDVMMRRRQEAITRARALGHEPRLSRVAVSRETFLNRLSVKANTQNWIFQCRFCDKEWFFNLNEVVPIGQKMFSGEPLVMRCTGKRD